MMAHFSGYQVRPGERTVQAELERVLAIMHKGEQVKVTASGRTDAKVHATGQTLHFDTPLAISAEKYSKALNVQLPRDIRVLSVEEVAHDFHARYDVAGKRYRYIWSCEPIQSPFRRYYTVETNGVKPNVEAMQERTKAIIGTHDFSCFCAANTSVKDKVRTVTLLQFEWHGEELHMVIEGMASYIIWYVLLQVLFGEVGIGRRKIDNVSHVVASGNRDKAGKTAPPQGLYLEKCSISGVLQF